MERLTGMAIFARVVEAGSFTAAASQLHLSKSAVSKAIAALEDRLNARLLNRTTRQFALTEVGHAFYQRCALVVAEAEEAEDAVRNLQAAPSGRLRVSAPLSFGTRHLAPALIDFMAAYPQLKIDIDFHDRFVDLIEESYDIAIRIVAALPDSSLVVRRLAESGMAVVASPAYWQRRGLPATPQDLKDHVCVTYRYTKQPNSWTFLDANGRAISVKVNGPLLTNNGDLSLQAALFGSAVALLPRFICGPDLANGRLQSALDDRVPPPLGIFALYPSGRYLSAKVRVFIDFLAERFSQHADWTGGPRPAA